MARYRPFLDREMLFGIRPEHITEQRVHTSEAQRDFAETVQVLEPMGMDTMVFLEVNGEEICARAAPNAVRPVGESMDLTIDMAHMHLIDPQSEKVV